MYSLSKRVCSLDFMVNSFLNGARNWARIFIHEFRSLLPRSGFVQQGGSVRRAYRARLALIVRAIKMKGKSLTAGIGYCTASSLVLAIGMAVLVVVEKHAYSESVMSLFLSSLVLWAVLGVTFSFLGALIIGVPVVFLLDGVGLFNPYVLSLVGAAVGYGIGGMSWVSSEQNPYIQVMLGVYGVVGALAFWYGASSNNRLQCDAAKPRA